MYYHFLSLACRVFGCLMPPLCYQHKSDTFTCSAARNKIWSFHDVSTQTETNMASRLSSYFVAFHPKNKIYILSDVSCLFVMQSEAQLDRVSFKFIPPSISLCPRGWENGLECPSLFLDPLLSGPLIYTLDADSSGSQPALNKKKKNGGEEVAGMGGRERELGRTKLGVGRNWTQCLLCVWREDLAQTLAGL